MLSILFPSHCFSCGQLGPTICLRCRNKLIPVQSETCIYCEKNSVLGLTHPTCTQKDGLDGAMSVLQYGGPLKTIITSIKFGLATDGWNDLFLSIRADFCYKLTPWLYLVGQDARFCPIPLHPQRRKERGFNQADAIYQFFQLFTNIPRDDVLIRKVNTPKQSQTINKIQRKKNIRKSFQWIKGKTPTHTLILVDDIITTGSTMHEAAVEAKKHGVGRVFALSLARG